MDSGRSGPTAKTKSVPKSVNKMEQLETMQKWKKSKNYNKNHPIITVWRAPATENKLKGQKATEKNKAQCGEIKCFVCLLYLSVVINQ